MRALFILPIFLFTACKTVPEAPAPIVVQPVQCPPEMSEPLQAEPVFPEEASIPPPTTPDQIRRLKIFLESLDEFTSYRKMLQYRVLLGTDYCNAISKQP